MNVNVNGTQVVMVAAGSNEKSAIAKGTLVLADGTKVYVSAYTPLANQVAQPVAPTTPVVRKGKGKGAKSPDALALQGKDVGDAVLNRAVPGTATAPAASPLDARLSALEANVSALVNALNGLAPRK